MEIKTKAIVLQTIKYGDAQLHGPRISSPKSWAESLLWSKSTKSSKAKIDVQLFQPLMILNLEFDHRPKLAAIEGCCIHSSPFVDVPFAFTSWRCLFLAELLGQATGTSR